MRQEEFQELYRQKRTTLEGIADRVQSGWVIVSDIGAALPYAIQNAIADRVRRGEITDIQTHLLLETQPQLAAYTGDLAGKMTAVSWFSGVQARKAINEGYADLMPCYYRDMPRYFQERVDADAFCLVVAPMDKHGYFSCGTNGSNVMAMLNKSKHVYLEVNEKMPRHLSARLIHISQVEALCEHTTDLPVLPEAEPDEVSQKIGDLIANEIPHGATIQIGIGAVPAAVCKNLRDKHDLGIHTELFTGAMVDLIECGAVTNMLKPIQNARSVATFCFGAKRVYEYIDDNPGIRVLPADYVNDPQTIAMHPDFISVNAALQVDFYGQVCAESVGTRHISGTGGQSDFVRGAVMSKGGKSFIAFTSTAKGGTVSRICPTLSPGALVSTSKNDVDRIVTEYGIAELNGRTLSQRVKALISIAHPKFRDELTYAAKQQHILI